MANISLDMLGGVNLNNNINPDILQFNGHEIWSAGNYSKGLEYEIVSNEAWVKGIGTCEDTVINIPEKTTIDGVKYNVVGISSSAFRENTNIIEVKIPDTVTTISGVAFYKCSNLKSVDIPDTVTNIGNQAFYLCTNLSNANIPKNIVEIGQMAFSGCSSLTEVTLPYGLETINNGAFSGCTGLTTVYIPTGVNVGNYAFSGCTGLMHVTISEEVNVGVGLFKGCENLTEAYIRNAIIGEDQFSQCTSLKTLSIDENLTTIGKEAFLMCYDLTDFEFPDSLISIGNSAFHSCESLVNVSIPKNVTLVDAAAFRNCYSLEKVNCYPEIPPIAYTTIFENDSKLLAINVPASSIGTYRSAQGWSDYADIMLPLANEAEFNYTGLDASGKMEGQIDFDGTIVSYAIGKPKITITASTNSETGEITRTETIDYDMCNGYNSEYFGGYDFVHSNTDTNQIVPSILVLPDTYMGKRVTKVLSYAFFAQGETTDTWYQSAYVEKVVLGANITTIGVNAFQEFGCNQVFRDIVWNDKIYSLELKCFYYTPLDEVNLPKSVVLCREPFNNVKKLIVNSDVVTLLNTQTTFGGCETVVFEPTVTTIFGVIAPSYSGTSVTSTTNLVFKGMDYDLTNVKGPKSAHSVTIYTDSTVVRNFDWASINITATFKPLSEYTG